MTCNSNRLNTVLLSLRRDDGKLSQPLVHTLRLSITLLISSSLVGLINILEGQVVLIYDKGFVVVDGIFLSRAGPMPQKNLLK